MPHQLTPLAPLYDNERAFGLLVVCSQRYMYIIMISHSLYKQLQVSSYHYLAPRHDREHML